MLSPHGYSTFTKLGYADRRLVLVMIQFALTQVNVWIRDSVSITKKKLGIRVGGTHDVGRVRPCKLARHLAGYLAMYKQEQHWRSCMELQGWFRHPWQATEWKTRRLLQDGLRKDGWLMRRPEMEHGQVDCLLVRGKQTLRVQLKTGTTVPRRRSCKLGGYYPHRRCWLVKGSKHQVYDPGDFDVLICIHVEADVLIGYWWVTLEELYQLQILPKLKQMPVYTKPAAAQARSISYKPSLRWYVPVR